MTSSMRYLVDPGITRREKRLTMIRTTPTATSFLRGHMMCRTTYWSEDRESFPRFFRCLSWLMSAV